jgi:hypothetical protein
MMEELFNAPIAFMGCDGYLGVPTAGDCSMGRERAAIHPFAKSADRLHRSPGMLLEARRVAGVRWVRGHAP